MNFDNLNKAIAVMERAQRRDSVNMGYWQTLGYHADKLVQSESELHACGNYACFAGHLAISPEWLEDPLNTLEHDTGCPVRERFTDELIGVDAIADWLNIPVKLANCLVNNVHDEYGIHVLYDVAWKDVRAEHIIRELKLLDKIGAAEYSHHRPIRH